MTNATQPTDSQMLDWIIINEVTMFKIAGKHCIFYPNDERCGAEMHKDPRQAVAAAMAKEEK